MRTTALKPRAFWSLSVAIMRGFIRDRSSVFFAIVFPLMFLVLFGGVFTSQDQPKVDLIQVGDVTVLDDLPAPARAAFEESFDITRSDDLDGAIAQVRKGDADVAVEARGQELVAHYTQTEQVTAAITQGVLRALVDGTNVALSGAPPTYRVHGHILKAKTATLTFGACKRGLLQFPPLDCRALFAALPSDHK